MKTKTDKLMKSAVFMVIATVMAKALGLIRDMLIAQNYGGNDFGVAFEAASRLPILLFDFVIGGVVTAAFIPIFNELLVKEGREKAFRFTDTYITVILLICIIISLLGVAFAPFLVDVMIPGVDAHVKSVATELTRIMFPMVIFTGLAFAFVGVLLSLGEFKIPAIISLVSNGVIVIYLFTVNRLFGVVGLALSMVFGWLVQAIVQVPKLTSLGYRYRFRFEFKSPYIKQALLGAVPILLATWTGPICSLINTRFSSGIEGGRAVAALGYANRFYTILIGVFSYVATNLLFPYIAKASAKGEKEEANKLMLSSVRILMLIIIPIMGGIIILAEPLIRVLYERGEFTLRDTQLTAAALVFYTVGMVFAAANEVFTKTFFARKRFFVPMFASIFACGVNFVLVIWLRDLLGIGGVALSSGIAVAIGCIFNYIALLRSDKRLFGTKDLLNIVKMLVAAGLMSAAVYFVSLLVEAAVLKLLLGVLTGVVVYALVCLVLKVEEAMFVMRKFFKRDTEEEGACDVKNT